MPVKITPLPGSTYISFDEKDAFLQNELTSRFQIETSSLTTYGNCLYNPNEIESVHPYWAATVLTNPFTVSFSSVGEAASALKAIQRNWASIQYTLFRRAALIQDKLPYINTKPKSFPFTIPRSPMGVWFLIDEHTLFASAQSSSLLPAGQISFVEDHDNPPSRAYLKIQEGLVQFQSFFGIIPAAGNCCFDAGACPGGWTWVLRQLDCSVFAVDRSPLADSLMADPAVTFMEHDAFTLNPDEIGPFDWVFSDVICYPERLFNWVMLWLIQKKVPNMICTIKMQGETDWKMIDKFACIPNSKVIHLNYNKHEFTWMHLGNSHDIMEIL